MKLNTRLDCDLVAVESADELTLLVELTAPTPSTTEVRQPATLQSSSTAAARWKANASRERCRRCSLWSTASTLPTFALHKRDLDRTH